ncbi:hypothetical protein IVA78_04260 [Bradyrhizobium sp. 137]|uniref:hypothetical protein n=1 Tax=Bradyrhizobium sp. 137 TaxID=2782614 RepID=UPI001FFC1B1E|nr:hypothetical protein [Bradyrhizobium sp. 137]MCK1754436.1 hypothetical protein [Bradyrhizobium sp. 137]
MALLFALDRNLPPLGERSIGPEVDRSIIRIHSARALPEKIIFDTSTQIGATVSSPLLAAEPPAHIASNALAMAEPRKPETNTPAPQRGATRAAGLRSNRAARSAASRRLYDRQVMVGAF